MRRCTFLGKAADKLNFDTRLPRLSWNCEARQESWPTEPIYRSNIRLTLDFF
jgi:hypothetical protein